MSEYCKNCKHFEHVYDEYNPYDICTMKATIVKGDYHCDNWQPKTCDKCPYHISAIGNCWYCAKRCTSILGKVTKCNEFKCNKDMEKIDKEIEILTAYKSGKTIEICSNNNWDVIKDREELLSQLYYNPYYLRIKPEQKYRPYANAEEFLKDSIKYGGYISPINNLNSIYMSHPVEITNTGITLNTMEHNEISFYDLLEGYKWSGTIEHCGKLE